jgi:hypothetical protein
MKLAQKKSYSRYFIILQEDEKGYSLSSDKTASGYAKLELKNDKCKISYYVQNLKKEMTPYYMVLVCNKKDVKKIIKISEMNIDDYGRADIFYEYPVSNVAGSNIAMDKVSGAAIVKLIEGKIISVMSGFATTEIPDWKNFVLIENENRNNDEAEQNVEERNTLEEKSIFDKYEESIEVIKQTERTENVDGEKEQELIEDVRDEVDNLEKEQVEEEIESLRQQDTEKVEALEPDKSEETMVIENRQEAPVETEEISDDFYEADKDYAEQRRSDENDFVDYPRGSKSKFFKSLAKGFEEVDDLCKDIKRCKWYRVNVKTIHNMYDVSDYNKYTTIYYPMISYYPYIKKYSHYLIGYKCDKDGEVKYLVYGIPGKKDRVEQPYGGKSGFVTWIPSDDETNYGYWLMFYDFKTATIIIPEKK